MDNNPLDFFAISNSFTAAQRAQINNTLSYLGGLPLFQNQMSGVLDANLVGIDLRPMSEAPLEVRLSASRTGGTEAIGPQFDANGVQTNRPVMYIDFSKRHTYRGADGNIHALTLDDVFVHATSHVTRAGIESENREMHAIGVTNEFRQLEGRPDKLSPINPPPVDADPDSPYPSTAPGNTPPPEDIKDLCFAAGTSVEMADGTTKPIEDIKLGDMVAAFDGDADSGRGTKVPKRVTQLHVNHNQTLIDFHGTRVTPGHVYLTGEGTFLPIIEILQTDGTVVNSDGKVIRARTGWEVGSKEDIAIPIGYPEGDDIKLTHMRAGTLYGGKDGKAYTIEKMMNSRGYHMMTDGRFIGVEGDIKTAYWEWGRPDDKMIAGKWASYEDLAEGSAIGIGMPLVPSRPN